MINKEKIVGLNPTSITDIGVSLDLPIHDLDLVEYITSQQVTQINKLLSYKKDHKESYLSPATSSTPRVLSWI
tara:strand:- start:6164 stop:6382 length:219 start_codon:yes stop_codon:yes gene_type:complete